MGDIKEVSNPDMVRKRIVSKSTPTPSLVSIGKKDRELLIYLLSNENTRFNLKEYSRTKNTPRSSVYESLNRLQKYDFIKRELGNNKITPKGKIYLETSNGMSEGSVGSFRRGCRDYNNLSTHFHTFKLIIKDRSKFNIERIKSINHIEFKENKLLNLHQVIIRFEDATIIINPKQALIKLYDIISTNISNSDEKCLPRALEYINTLNKIGIEIEGVMVEEGHWARVESVLSDSLAERFNGKYFLELDNGSKFWIDHSLGKNEDETNNKKLRENLDLLMNDISKTDTRFSDIDKIKEVLGIITKLEVTKLIRVQEENKKFQLTSSKLNNNYIG